LDAYWGVTDTERNPVKLLLYTSFFPLMVSGPINRHKDLGHQLFEEHRFDYESVTHGMKRIAWGFVKIFAVSVRLSETVDLMWDNVTVYHGILVWVVTGLCGFQLYAEFSGSMDVVIGVSECFGIKLAENFNAPLLSKTVQEFWRRWHITLGTWLRDYIMNPLLKSKAFISLGVKCKEKFGKKQGKKIPAYIAMLAVWLSMGLWHGNSWKYIVGMGTWFWLMIVIGQICEPVSEKIKNVLHVKDGLLWKTWQVIRTYFIFAVGTLSFHASTLPDALERIRFAFDFNVNWSEVSTGLATVIPEGITWKILPFIMLVGYDICLYRGVDLTKWISKRNIVIRWLVYFLLLLLLCDAYQLGMGTFEYAHF
jgi:D-alanyl-lipoteichoic acid acyltransferase DltB (MBOAT superfamily)